MPLEGHYERQTTPLYKLRPRELWVAASIVAVTLVTIIAMVVAMGASNSNPAPALGWWALTKRGRMGDRRTWRPGSQPLSLGDRCASNYTC